MNLDVFREVTFVTECLDAMCTFEWLFSGVFPDVPLQLSSSGAFILALLAFVWLLLGVIPPISPHVPLMSSSPFSNFSWPVLHLT